MNKGMYKADFQENYVVVDIETTGLKAEVCEIIEIGAIKVRHHEIIDTFQVLIKPTAPIPPFITQLTGISNEMVNESGMEASEAYAAFLAFVEEDIILGHNVSFDLSFLSYHILQVLGVFLTNDYADTCRLSRKLLKGQVPNCKLGTLTTYFGFDYSGAHRALADCHFTFQLYNVLMEVACGFR